MIKRLTSYMPSFMFIMALVGFFAPELGLYVFPYLPFFLFLVMLLTLLGIDQIVLIRTLLKKEVWFYAVLHTVFMMALSYAVIFFLPIIAELKLAIILIAATSSLFSTPAITRLVGLDAMFASALTIATTLLLPFTILLTLYFFPDVDAQIDLVAYASRLFFFLVTPMLMSVIAHKLFRRDKVMLLSKKIAPYSIFIIMTFPLGLTGQFGMFRHDHDKIILYLVISFLICFGFFFLAYFFYLKLPVSKRLVFAIACGNRNALLTYSVAGSTALGSSFLPLAGAMQIPTSILPIFTIFMAYLLNKRKGENGFS